MSSSYSINLKHLNEGGTYGANLWHAFQVFIAALCDVQFFSNSTYHHIEHDRAKAIDEMNNLAKKFDSTMPNQAAELRYLAAKDYTPA
jgi:hypothetical protein